MSQNTETPRVVAGAFQEVLFAAGGGTASNVARPIVLITRGRTEFLARCPRCQAMHRHVHLGQVTAPCGATYELRPRRAKRPT